MRLVPLPSPCPEITDTIAVVVTCHAAYLPFLAEALASIDAQVPAPAEKILALDDCEPPSALRPQLSTWAVLKGNWHTPNPARNSGWRATAAPWIVFWDADDVMPPGYLAAQTDAIAAAGRRCAIVYPRIARAAPGEHPKTKVTPFNYWLLRQCNWIGTQSAWRREAIERLGGWDEALPSRDDWNLSLRITAAGWTAEPLTSPAVILRRHDRGHRWSGKYDGWEDASWRSRTLAVVSRLSGRDDSLAQWRDWLLAEPLPLRASLYVLGDSKSAAFARQLISALSDLQPRFASITLVCGSHNHTALPHTDPARHQREDELHLELLQRIQEDLVLTLGDDVVPPPGALRKLHDPMARTNPIGAVAATYALPQHPAAVCTEHWRREQLPETSPAGLREADCVPGGCTLWANWALRNCLPLPAGRGPAGERIGWDAQLSAAIRQARYTLHLHGGVRCVRRIHL